MAADVEQPSPLGVRVPGYSTYAPPALVSAFEGTATITAAELCAVLPIDRETLRSHLKAGELACFRFGQGAGRTRFSLQHVMDFLEARSERACQSTAVATLRTTATTFAGAGSGILARLAKRTAEKQRQRNVS